MQEVERTKTYYDGIAKGYGELYHSEQENKISNILKFLPNSGNLLDLGSGDGVLNKFVNSNVELFSFDLSNELLKLNPNSEERKIQGSILDLPFENESFDFICSFTVFQDLPNPAKGVREAYRVLRKEGIFILSFLQISKKVDIVVNEVFKYFKIEKKIMEKKDMIFVLKKEL